MNIYLSNYLNVTKDEEFLLAVPTTESQREIWNSISFEPMASLAFNESIVIEFDGVLDIFALKKGINDLIERHTILRSVFSSDGQYQFVRKNFTFDLSHFDISTEMNPSSIFRKIQEDEINREFDLVYGPIIRFLLVTESSDKNYLLISAHHLICDGWSWAAINSDLGYFYNCHKFNRLPQLKPAYQFWQFVQKQREFKAENERSIQYWKNQFETIPSPINFPLEKVRPLVRSFESKRYDQKIESSIVKNLKRRSIEWGVSPYQLIYSLYLVALYEITGQRDLVVGISTAGQSLVGKKDLVGHCVSLLPIRFVVDDRFTFKQHAQNVKKVMLDALENQYCTFGEILRSLRLERDVSSIPLVSCVFNIDIQPANQGLNFEDLKARFSTGKRNFENFEMFSNLTMIGDQMTVEVQYSMNIFYQHQIQKWINVFTSLLENVSSENFSINELLPSVDFVPSTENKKRVDHNVNTGLKNFQYRQEVRERLKGIWEALLDRYDGVEINDDSNFFNLGGHSLIVSDMIVEIQKCFSLKITMKDIFLNPQLGRLAEVLSVKSLGTKTDNPFEIKSHYKGGLAPLSWQQMRCWYIQKLNPDSSLFNLAAMFHIHGAVDKGLFREALFLFLDRHLMTRAKLVLQDGMPYFKFIKSSQVVIEDQEMNQADSKKLKEDLHLQLDSFSRAPIDLDKDPLFYGKIYFNGDRDIFFYTKIHHLIWDGWSYDILMEELASIYSKLQKNGSFEQVEKESVITYPDYSLWQEEFKKSTHYQIEFQFWKDYLKGELPVLELPFDFPRDVKRYDADGFFVSWSEVEAKTLEEVAIKNGTTLFSLLMTAFKILLSRYTGIEDIIVGTPVRGRHLEGLNSLIGYFVNSVAVRSQISSQKSFTHNLKKVSENLISVFDHSNVPFDEIVKELKVARNPFHTPVYQAFMMFQDATARNVKFLDYDFSVVPFIRGSSHTDLDLWIRRDSHGMKGGFDFDIHRFKRETIERLADDFKALLTKISSCDELPLKEIDWISTTNSSFLINQDNENKVNIAPNSLLPQLFESQVDLFGGHVAASSSGLSFTYKELSEQSDRLAHWLHSLGVGEGKVVGVAHKRNARLPLVLLGIIKTGCAYVPLDPDYPQDRLDYMIQNSGIDIVIGDQDSIRSTAFIGLQKVGTDQEEDFWGTIKKAKFEKEINPKSLCYIIYTSGSTGLPKGVSVTHSSVANFLLSMKKTPGIKSSDRLCAITTLNFDIAVLEIYLPLICGAESHIVPKEISMFAESLSEELVREKITILQATPATWKQLLNEGTKHTGIKALCGGEALGYELAQGILQSFSQLWNMYGPTETTVWSTCKQINKSDVKITLGKPIANTKIYILNENGEICPVGVVGEIHIGGHGLAVGYYKRDELTKERFVSSSLSKESKGERLYRTGDLGKINPQGELECVGRNDGQVKVRGFRIELGEIESVVSQFESIQENVIMAKEIREGDVRIVCYYKTDSLHSQFETKLRKWISEKLPSYMMPSNFHRMEFFPLTLNGKIDKKKLPDVFSHLLKNDPMTVDDQNEVLEGNDIYNRLARIWISELGVNEVKSEDDFFDLGGHSLLSIRVFAKIEKEFGIKLPLSSLFHYSVFGKLVKNIEEKLRSTEVVSSDEKKWEPISLTEMRIGKSKENPIYFFHAVGGNTLNYRILLDYIDSDYRIYGLQAPGVNGENKLAESIIELAVLYAREIEFSLKGEKSCILIGGSMGGLIAIETARILKEKGIEIEKLIMFDTFGPNLDLNKCAPEAKNTLLRICDFLKNRSRYFINRLKREFYLSRKIPLPHDLRYYFIEINNYQLIHRHKIRPYNGKVYIMRMPIDSKGPYADPDLGWKNVLLGEVVFTYIDGVNHVNFVESPVTAYELGKFLKK
ncbi:MAG: amino acid adenylation domain-containing protein [Bacteriovorax sp.]|nr:amino acid adenylation domain-containing protein [Bacteriovorax sp.]